MQYILAPRGTRYKKILFVDRDGTLNREFGYIRTLAEFQLFDSTLPALRLIKRAGWGVVVVSNQSGIARGFLDERMLDRITRKMLDELNAGERLIDAVYYALYHPDSDHSRFRRRRSWRKPRPGMLLSAARRFGAPIRRCLIAGDRITDIAAGVMAGCRTGLVLTGAGRETRDELSALRVRPNFSGSNLQSVVRRILSAER